MTYIANNSRRESQSDIAKKIFPFDCILADPLCVKRVSAEGDKSFLLHLFVNFRLNPTRLEFILI
jgi:hypothetical protein